MFINRLLELLNHANLGTSAFVVTSMLTKFPQFCSKFPHDEKSFNYFNYVANTDHQCKKLAGEIATNIYTYNQSQYK